MSLLDWKFRWLKNDIHCKLLTQQNSHSAANYTGNYFLHWGCSQEKSKWLSVQAFSDSDWWIIRVYTKQLEATFVFVDFSKVFSSIYRRKMKQIYWASGLSNETVTAIMKLYKTLRQWFIHPMVTLILLTLSLETYKENVIKKYILIFTCIFFHLLGFFYHNSLESLICNNETWP